VPGDPALLLSLRAVSKVFKSDDEGELETRALDNIHLDVRRGEWLAIVGQSGSGKTTLLSLLGLIEPPSSGSFLFEEQAVEGLGEAARGRLRSEKVGFIFQAFNLIGDLTVQENVELPLRYRGLSAAERRDRAEAALARVGMGHRRRHLPGQLSGGQQQRVAVARAVAGDPPLLLADEPTGNLDSKNGQAVMQLLGDLHKGGATVCMVTHEPSWALRASRSVTLFDGRIVGEQ
jgi:putative ABC transport system ATP-binding protein